MATVLEITELLNNKADSELGIRVAKARDAFKATIGKSIGHFRAGQLKASDGRDAFCDGALEQICKAVIEGLQHENREQVHRDFVAKVDSLQVEIAELRDGLNCD